MKPLVEKQVGPDLMLYDGEADSVHILNPVAQAILGLHRKGLAPDDFMEGQKEAAVPDHSPDLGILGLGPGLGSG